MSLFAPPRIIETEVFAAVPARLRKNTMPAERLASGGGAITGGSFLEGPSFDRAGNLYVVDIPYGRIFRVSPKGDFDVAAEYDGEPNGLRIHKDGRIFVADHKLGILLLDPASGKVTPFITRYHREHFKGLNDLTFDANGCPVMPGGTNSGVPTPSTTPSTTINSPTATGSASA